MRPFSVALAAAALLWPSMSNAAPASAGIMRALQDRLVKAEGGRLTPVPTPKNVRVIAFYFGAGWCGPCRAFVPELKRGYARMRAARAPIELVFVSDDADCRRMADYILSSRMPWPAVACRDRDRLGWLQRARGRALPGLLVYGAEGRLLLSNWSRGGRSRPHATLAELERRFSKR